MSVLEFQKNLIIPENNKASFTEYDNVDFLIAPDVARNLVGNSVRITGNIRVLNNGANVAAGDKIYFDEKVGVSAFVSQIQTSFQTKGQVELANEVGRYEGMLEDAQSSHNDMCVGSKSCELKVPMREMSELILTGRETNTTGQTPVLNDPVDFSYKPNICLNNCEGNQLIPFSKTGAIRVVLTLARHQRALFGSGVSSTTTYSMTNLQLHYKTAAASTPVQPVAMKVKYHIRQAILSGASNLNAKVPASCNSVAVSFIKQADEGGNAPNSLARQVLPKTTRVQFLFNNSTAQRIQYPINNREEVLLRYLDAMKDGGKHSSMTLKKLKGNESYGVGLSFGEYISLVNDSLNIQLDSAVNSSEGFSAHMFFHSLMVL
jgi:hypothetical protein